MSTNNFEAFGITSIPFSQNTSTNTLDNATSRFSPLTNVFSVEFLFRPLALDNIMKWRELNDDEKIKKLLTSDRTFKGVFINDEEHENDVQKLKTDSNNFKGNLVPI
jgi:hypothetical protein